MRVFNNMSEAKQVETAKNYIASVEEDIKVLYGDLSGFTIREIYDMDWHNMEGEILEGVKSDRLSQTDTCDMLQCFDELQDKQTEAACNYGLSFDFVEGDMEEDTQTEIEDVQECMNEMERLCIDTDSAQYRLDELNDQGMDERIENSYYRYQICWGGPSMEFRIYKDGDIVSVYLDWFCGYSETTEYEVAELLRDWFDSTCSIDWDTAKLELIG